MQFPSIKVLSFELDFLNEIDIYTSLDFRRLWQGVGDFTLTLCRDYSVLRKNNIIMLGSDPHKVGIIRSVERVSDKKGITVTVSGQTLDGLTSQRTVLPLEDNEGYFSVPPQAQHRIVSAEEIVKQFIFCHLGEDAEDVKRRLRDSEGRSLLKTGELKNRGFRTEWGCRYTQLDEELQAICEYCDCGYEIYIDFDNKVYVAEYVPGVDRSVGNGERSWVILSKDFESIEDIKHSVDYSSYKNVAYAGGTGDGADRTVIAVTNDEELASGIDRFETFVDCGELENIETETAMSLSETGKHKLEEYNFAESLTATVSPSGSFRYGEQWDLGDLVTIRDNDLNVEQDMRISEVTESYEPNSYKLTVTLGKAPKRLNRAIRSIKPAVK